MAFGRGIVREMNRLGMMVDLSHAAEQAFYDTRETSIVPILNTYAACRALANHPRSLTDDMLSALAKNRGVLGVAYYTGMLGDNLRARFSELAEIDQRRGEVRKQFERRTESGAADDQHEKHAPAGSHKFRVPFDAAGKKWVRFAVWDSAGNGAFTQPLHLN